MYSLECLRRSPLKPPCSALALGLLLSLAVPVFADDDPPADTTLAGDQARAAGDAIKRNAKQVAEAVREGSQQAASTARQLAKDVAGTAKEGAQQVAASTRKGARKVKSTVAGDQDVPRPEKTTDKPATP